MQGGDAASLGRDTWGSDLSSLVLLVTRWVVLRCHSLGWHLSSGEVASQSDTRCWTAAPWPFLSGRMHGGISDLGAIPLGIYGGRGASGTTFPLRLPPLSGMQLRSARGFALTPESAVEGPAQSPVPAGRHAFTQCNLQVSVAFGIARPCSDELDVGLCYFYQLNGLTSQGLVALNGETRVGETS